MKRWMYAAVVCSVLVPSIGHPNAADDLPQEAERKAFVTTYAIADLIASPANDGKLVTEELERHLKEVTGSDVWKSGGSIEFYPTTLSLVIRQTQPVHERIADELACLRAQLNVQTNLAIHVIAGPRTEIAALAQSYRGEFGRFERDELLERVQRSKSLTVESAPKVTVFSKQSFDVRLNGRVIAANAEISDDRRAVRLKISERDATSADVLGNVEIVDIHSGRTSAIRFEAPTHGVGIPPSKNATERLVLVTPNVVVQEEEEELLGLPR